LRIGKGATVEGFLNAHHLDQYRLVAQRISLESLSYGDLTYRLADLS